MGEAQPAPRPQVVGDGQGDTRARETPRDVRHHVQVERFHIGHPRVLTAAGARAQLVWLLGLERVAKALDARGIALIVELDPCDPDPRVVALTDDTWEQIELAVGPPRGGRVEHTLALLRNLGIGLHNQAETLDRGGKISRLVHEGEAVPRELGLGMLAPIIGKAAIFACEIGDLVFPVFKPMNLAMDEDEVRALSLKLIVKIAAIRLNGRHARAHFKFRVHQ